MSNLPFVEEILADLRRFKECVEDGQDVDLTRDRFDLLTKLGLLERGAALWVMTQAGEDAISQPAGRELALPERRPGTIGTWGDMGDAYNEGWNDCLDAVAASSAPPAAPVAAGEPATSAKQLADALKLVRCFERQGQAPEWEFEVPGSYNRHVVASSEQVARAKVAQDVRRETPPAAAHGDEAVRKDATESAIQRACDVLPEDWTMQIDLERGAGCVTLFNPWGSVVDFGQDFESIGAEVEAAIAAAMRAQAGEGGEV